ncbi:GNAT family acetyltransferase [Oscillatoria sp. CS-180]|uniref:GNAT family acetyltransferase n=1 Tax=Oscillatoria sp. CS-180 TaxID=3021720 RepID=UPI00232ADAA2|nr:GNAT family acetyltransferase [Oscillatoria sp. CS-180]MDB9529800.1 GNAT family acetyltransferase [Oscillatoria sp. CS-180]
MLVRPFQANDAVAVVTLWERVGLLRSWNNPYRDIQRKLAIQPEGFLIGVLDGQVVATVMAGYDGHRGWINYLAIAPEYQRAGYGREMMHQAEEWLLKLGCPKINLQIRRDNLDAIAFYEAIGFTEDAVVSVGKRLISDR